MGRDEQLDEGQNPHYHKQKGRTKENPSEYCCLRSFAGDDTVGYQGHTAQKAAFITSTAAEQFIFNC